MRNLECFKEEEVEDEADEIRSEEELSADEDNEDAHEWIDPERLQDKNRKKKRLINYLHIIEDIGPRINKE